MIKEEAEGDIPLLEPRLMLRDTTASPRKR